MLDETRYYRVDLILKPETSERLNLLTADLDVSVNGFATMAVFEYLRAKGLTVEMQAIRTARRYVSRNSLEALTRRTLFFPTEWRGAFTMLALCEDIDARLAVRVAVCALMDRHRKVAQN